MRELRTYPPCKTHPAGCGWSYCGPSQVFPFLSAPLCVHLGAVQPLFNITHLNTCLSLNRLLLCLQGHLFVRDIPYQISLSLTCPLASTLYYQERCSCLLLVKKEERMEQWSCQVGHGCPGGHQGPESISKLGSCLPFPQSQDHQTSLAGPLHQLGKGSRKDRR